MAPKANSKQSPRENPAAVAESPESLDKVRDILFGSHMRSVEGRIARIEERLLREQQTLRADLEAALAGQESFARKELEALNEKVKAERAKRAEDLKALLAETREALKAVDKRLAKLDEATSGADAELRSELLEAKRDHDSLIAVFSKTAERLSEELKGAPAS